jgi:hypothetical protein
VLLRQAFARAEELLHLPMQRLSASFASDLSDLQNLCTFARDSDTRRVSRDRCVEIKQDVMRERFGFQTRFLQ